MTDYYDGRELATEPWKQSGWNRQIGQYLRFELACDRWDWARIDSVLDVGCGTADLSDYLRQTGRAVTYTGFDARERAVEQAREQYPGLDVRRGDLFDTRFRNAVGADGPFDLVLAIGVQVDGEAIGGEERMRRTQRLVDACRQLSSGGMALVVLDQQAIESRPMLDLEPALWGLTREELAGIDAGPSAQSEIRTDGLATDLVWYGWTDATIAEASAGGDGAWEPHRRVEERYLRSGGDPIDVVWMWVEAERPDEARRVLREEGVDAGPERRLMLRKIRRLESR